MSVIMEKLRKASKEKSKEVKEFFVTNDPQNQGTVPYESFRLVHGNVVEEVQCSTVVLSGGG